MKTRLGKIAQLPKSVRDDLNHRLQNGQQGRDLLAWLNELPETKELLAKFKYDPINKSNLSDWRHGAYAEWLQDQAREARIQRISESGASLQKAETGDLFENFARFAVAELMADLDSLQKFRGEKRSRALHELIRDLARLQFGYNHSRRTDLAWTKYNDNLPPRPGSASVSAASRANTNPSSTTAVVPGRAGSCNEKSHDAPPEQTAPRPIIRTPSHHKTCGCLCKHCHPEGSEYPYEYALADQNESKRLGTTKIQRGQTAVYLRPVECNCPCPEHASAPATAVTPQPNGVPPSPAAATLSTQPPPQPAPPSTPKNPAAYDSISECLRRISLLASPNPSNHEIAH